jgi:hypothetical protein
MPVLVISDTHINSTLSVCPSSVNLDDGGTYNASSWQRQLWEGWLEMAEVVRAKVGERDLTLILNGDLCEFDTKARSSQLISRNDSFILGLTVETLDPFVSIANKSYVIRGTEAHVGSFEEKIAVDIDAIKDPDRGTSSFWHLRRIFDNRRFDVSHHISGNTEMAVINLARRILMSAQRRGETLPNYVIRSHVHRAWDTGKTFPNMRVMTTGSWTGLNAYTYRIGAENELPQISMLYFDGGLAEPEYLSMAFAPRTWENG